MPREIQESRRAYVAERAVELALTGAFASCHAIEVSLRSEGFIDARELLGSPKQREMLSETCTQSKSATST
jgi:hypothetical protein